MSAWQALLDQDARQRFTLEALLRREELVWPRTVAAVDWPPGLVDALRAAGVLVEGPTLARPVCLGCANRCALPVETRDEGDGDTLLVGLCALGEVAGLLTFPLDALDTWRLDASAIAVAIARGLGLVGEVEEVLAGRVWRLGDESAPRRAVYLARGREPAPSAVREAHAVVLATHADAWTRVLTVPVVPLRRVVSALPAWSVDRDALPAVARPAVASGRDTRPLDVPAGTTWRQVTMRFVDDDVVEVVVAGTRTRLSATDFGLNDNRRSTLVPGEPWKLLRLMAERGGELALGDMPASANARAYVKKLRERLGATIPVEGDPFVPRRVGSGWAAAFVLVDGRRR